jgi:hypothetical protein
MPTPDFDIDAALEEVREKEEIEIEVETAFKWASRSCACYQLYDETNEVKWLLSAASYENEALEHAAMAKDNASTLKVIEAEIEKYKPAVNDKLVEASALRKIKLAKLFE